MRLRRTTLNMVVMFAMVAVFAMLTMIAMFVFLHGRSTKETSTPSKADGAAPKMNFPAVPRGGFNDVSVEDMFGANATFESVAAKIPTFVNRQSSDRRRSSGNVHSEDH